MAEAWEQWHGEIIGGYHLRQYLGGSDHSAVFLAERVGDPQPVVLKLVPAVPATADSQMARWELGKKLNHPDLVRILGAGRCQLGGSPFLYVVTERADENLSQILPQRALSPRETGDMLRSVLDALGYLHNQGFAHSHIAPSNIMAVGDQIKLTSDTASPTGVPLDPSLAAPGNDLLEGERAGVSKAADIWSLGATLVEVLTQRRTAWEETAHGELLFREKLPEPFREIAQRCLNRDSARRPTVAEIRGLLDPTAAGKLSAGSVTREPGARRAILVAAIAVIALLAILGWTKLSSRSPLAIQTPQAAPTQTPRTLPEPQPETGPEVPPKRQSKPIVPPPPEPSHEASRGAVAHEILPSVPRSARNTITGRVRVTVRVQVDDAGNVTNVSLDSTGPSKYFARLASEAARQWTFTPPRVNGRDVPSEWLLRFAFGRTDTTVSPTQVKP